jgi:hypothetical protein
MTSSNSSTFLRDWKLRLSTVFWALLDGVGEHLVVEGRILVHAQRLHHVHDRSPPNRRIRSSSWR